MFPELSRRDNKLASSSSNRTEQQQILQGSRLATYDRVDVT
jgi:hypothetical protein